MKKRFLVLLTIFGIGLAVSSCLETDQLKTKLHGTWELDSTSTQSGEYIDVDGKTKKVLTFIDMADYSFEWWTDDVGNVFTGKYFILDNPKRGLKTISFIPDIQLDDKDTIRIPYMHFDIVSINSTRLQVVDETEFIKRDNRDIRFSQNYIYKRVK